MIGSPGEVKAHCRELIETIGAEGGYIMDASAIMQNDATIENLRAMTDATLEYGVYRSPSSPSPPLARLTRYTRPAWMGDIAASRPGVCFPWEEKLKELPPICGDPFIPERIWNDAEGLAYLYIWHVLLSF